MSSLIAKAIGNVSAIGVLELIKSVKIRTVWTCASRHLSVLHSSSSTRRRRGSRQIKSRKLYGKNLKTHEKKTISLRPHPDFQHRQQHPNSQKTSSGSSRNRHPPPSQPQLPRRLERLASRDRARDLRHRLATYRGRWFRSNCSGATGKQRSVGATWARARSGSDNLRSCMKTGCFGQD